MHFLTDCFSEKRSIIFANRKLAMMLPQMISR